MENITPALDLCAEQIRPLVVEIIEELGGI